MKSPQLLGLMFSFSFFALQAQASCMTSPSEMLAAAQGGDKGGNAGSGMEILFRAKADEVLDWVKRNRLSKIDTHGHDREKLSDQLLMQKWRVCMTEDQVYVDGRERTCRNSFDPKKPDLIECSATAFENRETDDSRYALVFHELLGVAGVEKNLEGESDDSLSRQILKFVGSKMTPYLSDEQITRPGKVIFVQSPIHAESGLPFGIQYEQSEGSWICKYLGYREYVAGAMQLKAVRNRVAHFTKPDFSFEIQQSMLQLKEIGCR